jgi:hypothetical protein
VRRRKRGEERKEETWRVVDLDSGSIFGGYGLFSSVLKCFWSILEYFEVSWSKFDDSYVQNGEKMERKIWGPDLGEMKMKPYFRPQFHPKYDKIRH